MKPKALKCLAAFMFLLTPAVSAQVTKDTQQGVKEPRGKAALRISIAKKTRALLATRTFAALKIARARMISEFYAKHPQGDGEPPVEVDAVQIAEEELYRALAGSLQEFIQQFEGTPGIPEVQAARVITARLLIHVGETSDAIQVLEDFDWEDARVGDILGAVELHEFFRIQKVNTAPLLIKAVKDAGSVEEQMDGLFLALRLNKEGSDLPNQILKIIEGSADTLDKKAAVILGEAEIVFRLNPVIVEPIPTTGEPGVDTVDKGDQGGGDAGQPVDEPVSGVPTIAGKPDQGGLPGAAGLPKGISGADPAIFRRRGTALDADEFIERVQSIALRRPVRTVPIEPGVIPVPVDPGDIQGQPIDSTISGIPGDAGAIGTPTEIAGQAQLYVDLLGTVVQDYPSTEAASIAVRRLMAFRLDEGMDGVPFEGVTDDGEVIHLSDFAGEVLLLDFWDTGSIESLAERPKIAAIYETYHASGLDIVSINLDDEADVWAAKALVADLDMDWHNVIEGIGTHSVLARTYNVDGTPHRVLIDGEGDIIATDGELDFEGGEIESAIQRAIMELKPVITDPADDPIIIIDEEPYSGPKVQTTLEIDGTDIQGAAPIKGEAPNYAVNVSVTANTGGWDFRHDQTIVVGGVTQVRLTLVSPRPDEPVTMVITTKTVHVPLGTQVSDTIQIRVARTIRGVNYEEYPPYLLADTVGLPTKAYDGPPIQVELGSTDGIPPTHFMTVKVEVPTGGYTLTFDERKHSLPGSDPRTTQVYLTLTSPGAAELVPQIIETKTVFVELGEDPGKVEVLVRQIQRASGEPGEYVVAKSLDIK